MTEYYFKCLSPPLTTCEIRSHIHVVCHCISRLCQRAWHIVAYSEFLLNEWISANLNWRIITNNTSFFGHKAAPSCIILCISKCISHLILPTSLWGHLYLCLTEKKKERFSHSFIQQAPALCQALCWVLGIQSWIRHGPCPQGVLVLMEEMDKKAAVSVQLVSAVRHVYRSRRA